MSSPSVNNTLLSSPQKEKDNKDKENPDENYDQVNLPRKLKAWLVVPNHDNDVINVQKNLSLVLFSNNCVIIRSFCI